MAMPPQAGPTGGGASPAPPPATPVAPPGAQAGISPATGPVSNAGQSAAGAQLMGGVVNLMSLALMQVGPASPAGQDLLESIKRLSRHVPPGAVSPAQQMNQLKALMVRAAQHGPQVAQMQQQAAHQMAAPPPPQAQAA